MRRRTRIFAAAVLILTAGASGASEDIAFVAEHLPEVAMDDRYAALPLWARGVDVSAGLTAMSSGTLDLRGPTFDVAGTVGFHGLTFKPFAFFDSFSLTSGRERRPLDEPFVATPLALPAAAEFRGLDGRMSDAGVGFAVGDQVSSSWLGEFDWFAGLLYQRVHLTDYRLDYLVLDGPDAGATGVIDFSATYAHLTPFVGFGKRFARGDWSFAPHVQLAVPLPRRGVSGRILGPGFDLAGDSADNGAGKHFGDPSVTVGFDVTYQPWDLTLDAGSFASQWLLEPHIHEGVDQNWMLHLTWSR
ncbi:MAG TPA: hypothetical protein VMF52_03335 [Steroidobacteraceae bacterium]|nr:hypothetical protein [Steroidobacteraceae bacterium]